MVCFIPDFTFSLKICAAGLSRFLWNVNLRNHRILRDYLSAYNKQICEIMKVTILLSRVWPVI